MMKVHLVSDLHLGHRNLLRGGRIGIRPFDSLVEMHGAIIDGWNSVVKPNDKVYMLGDLTLERPKRDGGLAHFWDWLFAVCAQLQGHKRILLGNHDYLSTMAYQLLGFEKVYGSRELGGCLLTHMPIHPSQFYRYAGNIHGHTHEKHVLVEDWQQAGQTSYGEGGWSVDHRYLNVCVEALNYVPITIDEAVAILRRKS